VILDDYQIAMRNAAWRERMDIAYRERYDECIAAGMTPQEAESEAIAAGEDEVDGY
jgi:hypothetical protein